MEQQALTNDARHILAVDPAGEATTVATGPMQVSDLAQVTVRDYPGLGAKDAVRRFIAEEAVEAKAVPVAQVVTEPDATTPTRTRLHAELCAVLGEVSVWFCDRRDAQVRAWLTAPTGLIGPSAARPHRRWARGLRQPAIEVSE